MNSSDSKSMVHDSSEDLLLIIDFQNVYLPGEEWACPTIRKSMENVIRIVKSPIAPEYLLTQYIAPEKPLGCWQRYNDAYLTINSDPYLCDLTEEIKEIASEDHLIIKDTYSSLMSPAVMKRISGKKRLVLSGVVAECCILATMMQAIDLGYEVIYLYDCISGMTTENERMIRTLAESFTPIHTQVMSSREYLQTIFR